MQALSCVCQLSENNPLSRKLEISILVHDAGAFSAKLEGDWNKLFCRGFHDNFAYFAYGNTARKKDIVKFLPQELLVCLHSPFNNGHIFGRNISSIISDITVDTAGASSDGLMTAYSPQQVRRSGARRQAETDSSMAR